MKNDKKTKWIVDKNDGKSICPRPVIGAQVAKKLRHLDKPLGLYDFTIKAFVGREKPHTSNCHFSTLSSLSHSLSIQLYNKTAAMGPEIAIILDRKLSMWRMSVIRGA